MNVDIDKVITTMSEQIGSLTKDNIILRVLVQQLEEELQSVRETQVKKEGSGVQTPPTAS
jgi:regulator of replication initiation timing